MLFTLQGEDFDELSASVLFTYTAIDASTGRVDLQVTNTSTEHDPLLTGLAFNLPVGVTSLTSFTTSIDGWAGSLNLDGINTPSNTYGRFDIGALTGNNFNGGNPQEALARGETGNFSFVFGGTSMNLLSEEIFLSQLSSGGTAPEYFIGRFQQVGADGGQSDVAIPGDPPTAVPEPTTLLLTGLGFLGAAALRRRRAH